MAKRESSKKFPSVSAETSKLSKHIPRGMLKGGCQSCRQYHMEELQRHSHNQIGENRETDKYTWEPSKLDNACNT